MGRGRGDGRGRMMDRSIPGVWGWEVRTFVGSGCWAGSVGGIGGGEYGEGKLRVLFFLYLIIR